MQPKYMKPAEQIIYQFARAGLIHKYRECWYCGTRMIIARRESDNTNYVWECTLCGQKMKLTKNTPMAGINLRSVDQCLELWLVGANGKLAQRLSYSFYGDRTMYKIFRKSCARYFAKRIAPYIVLPGPVEIDEAQVGAKRFWLFPY